MLAFSLFLGGRLGGHGVEVLHTHLFCQVDIIVHHYCLCFSVYFLCVAWTIDGEVGMVQQGEACLTATAGLVATGAGEPFGFKVSRLLLSLKVILLNVNTVA